MDALYGCMYVFAVYVLVCVTMVAMSSARVMKCVCVSLRGIYMFAVYMLKCVDEKTPH